MNITILVFGIITLIILMFVYVFYSIIMSRKAKAHQPSHIGQATKKSYGGWIMGGVVVAILFFLLSFHIIPDYLMIFPKEHLTFSNTFINKSDVDNLIDRYNDASLFEKQTIRQEPLMRKLIEKGIITHDYQTSAEKRTSSIIADLEREALTNREAPSNRLDFLMDYDGKYPTEVKLFENSAFNQRLKRLVGDEYDLIYYGCAVETPATINNNFFIVGACQQHNCAGINYTVVYDYTNDILYVGIKEEEELRSYSEKGNPRAILNKYSSRTDW